MKKLSIACVVAVALFVPAVAQAQEGLGSQIRPVSLLAADTSTVRATPVAIDARDFEKRLFGEKRSPVLLSLYGSLAALNAADVVTTRKVMARGGRELNPFMQEAAGNTMMMSGVKLATTAATVIMIDRISKKNRRAGVISAVVANGLMAAVVAHNVRQLR